MDTPFSFNLNPLFAAANPLLTFRGPFSIPLSLEPVSPSEHVGHPWDERSTILVKKARTILPIFQTLLSWVTSSLVEIDGTASHAHMLMAHNVKNCSQNEASKSLRRSVVTTKVNWINATRQRNMDVIWTWSHFTKVDAFFAAAKGSNFGRKRAIPLPPAIHWHFKRRDSAQDALEMH